MAQPANIQGNIFGQLQQQAAGQQAAPAGQQQQQATPARQQQPVAGQPVQINANGALKGNPPAVFNGDCTKSSGFLIAVKLFKAANRNNEAMSNPYSRVTTVLTYMTGDTMEPWKEDQLNLLNGQVNTGTLETDEQLWNLFEADFKQAFTNTHKARDAMRELNNHQHKDNLDTYIADFKRLARDAGIPLNDIGTIELFKRGLKKPLLDAIIDTDAYDPLTQNPWDFERWSKEAVRLHGKWKEKIAHQDRCHDRLYRAFGVNKKGGQNGGKRITSQGGIHMDVDAIRTTNHSEEKKAELMKNNQCFYCEIRGHHAKDCRKKAKDCAAQSNGGTAPKVTTAPNQLTPDELAKLIQESMGSLEEDAKLSIIENLMPKDFVQGPN